MADIVFNVGEEKIRKKKKNICKRTDNQLPEPFTCPLCTTLCACIIKWYTMLPVRLAATVASDDNVISIQTKYCKLCAGNRSSAIGTPEFIRIKQNVIRLRVNYYYYLRESKKKNRSSHFAFVRACSLLKYIPLFSLEHTRHFASNSYLSILVVGWHRKKLIT